MFHLLDFRYRKLEVLQRFLLGNNYQLQALHNYLLAITVWGCVIYLGKVHRLRLGDKP